jgi:hypothetical protein
LCIYFLLILFKFWVWIRKRGGPNNVVWGYVSCRRRCFMDNFRLARQNRRTVSSLDAIYSSTTDGRTDGRTGKFSFYFSWSWPATPARRVTDK